MTDDTAEFCMICRKTGPVNFECEHSDAHLPLATTRHDANGEPCEDEDD